MDQVVIERLVASLKPEGIEYIKQALNIPENWNSIMVSAWLGLNDYFAVVWNNNDSCLQNAANLDENNIQDGRDYPLPLDALKDEVLHSIYIRLAQNQIVPNDIGSPEWEVYFRDAFRPTNRNVMRDRIIIRKVPFST
jgi:hypothetical protein